MKIWKKNVTAAAVLVTVCAGIYLNWMYTEGSSVAVAAPESGLQQKDVAVITDIILTQSDYEVEDIRIVEVQ